VNEVKADEQTNKTNGKYMENEEEERIRDEL